MLNMKDLFTKNKKIRSEGQKIEYKEFFKWDTHKSKYVRIMSSFANNKGGKIYFGVDDSKKLVGLDKESEFFRVKVEDVERYTKNCLDGNFEINMYFDEYRNNKIGIIKISESENKPIICKKNSGDNLQESDIYFRYNAESRKIRYSELSTIIDKKEKNQVLEYLKDIETIMKKKSGQKVMLGDRGTIFTKDSKKKISINDIHETHKYGHIELVKYAVKKHNYYYSEIFRKLKDLREKNDDNYSYGMFINPRYTKWLYTEKTKNLIKNKKI